MKTPRVGILCSSLSPFDGWGRVSREIVARLPEHGVDSVVLLAAKESVEGIGTEVHAGILHSLKDDRLKQLQILRDKWTAHRLLAGCDIVHAMAEPLAPVARVLCGRNKVLMITAHGTYAVLPLKRRWSHLYQRAFGAAQRIFAVSRYTASRLEESLPEVGPKVLVARNGVTVETDKNLPNRAERENSFLAVGGIKPRKGTLIAVEALAEVREEFPDTCLYVVGAVGDAAYAEEVFRSICSLGLEDSVRILGSVSAEELRSVYSRVLALVMPSINDGDRFEGFGLVHLEANSLGVPSIGSKDCGNEEAIREGVSGFLVQQGDVRGLADCMKRLLNPSYDWDKLSRSSLGHAMSMDWDATVELYAQCYKDALEAPT